MRAHLALESHIGGLFMHTSTRLQLIGLALLCAFAASVLLSDMRGDHAAASAIASTSHKPTQNADTLLLPSWLTGWFKRALR